MSLDYCYMNAPSLTPTRREVRRYARKNGYSYAEATFYLSENRLHAHRFILRAEFARLSALDTTEFQEHVSSAECNALDTCEEEGLPRDSESTRFWEMAVATLDMFLDGVGVNTRLPR